MGRNVWEYELVWNGISHKTWIFHKNNTDWYSHCESLHILTQPVALCLLKKEGRKYVACTTVCNFVSDLLVLVWVCKVWSERFGEFVLLKEERTGNYCCLIFMSCSDICVNDCWAWLVSSYGSVTWSETKFSVPDVSISHQIPRIMKCYFLYFHTGASIS